MKSTAQVNGHPIHPMLIPYPFALLSSAVAFDLAARATGSATWSATATHLTAAGLGTAVAAAIPGVIDYFGSVPAGKPHRDATTHALLNVSALACFGLAFARRGQGGRLPASGLALSVIGTGLLSLAGWFGGQLIYHHHVGVDDEGFESRALPAPTGARSLPF
jgi:uncharacterized membrane protein